MSDAALFIVPALRWDSEYGFSAPPQRARIETALELGCGAYIIFGGEAAAVRDITTELRERSVFPLLIASDLERGAGQQFKGATGLPPLAAIGASSEQSAASRAARLTAREALALGVNWVLAPVSDLDLDRNNPIIGTRSFGSDPAVVAAKVSEWVDACQASGALACAKHFPGHGRTAVDSHATLPTVNASAEELRGVDLAPFRAAIEAGVASILTAHVNFPALDRISGPATLSRKIVNDLLRDEMHFDGIIVTDAMIMAGALQDADEEAACVAALAAGCDLVLYPENIVAVAGAVEKALERGVIPRQQARVSLDRREKWAAWAASPGAAVPQAERDWARSFALGSVAEVRGRLQGISQLVDLVLVDDDVGGPYPPPSREPFPEALRSRGVQARWVDAPTFESGRSVLVALFGDIRSWKGRAGYSQESVAAVARVLEREPDAVIIQFSHPRLAEQLPTAASHVVSAWGGEQVMQEAAAAWVAARIR